jgi:glycosyltransferase involved in cell wall biosynthesis
MDTVSDANPRQLRVLHVVSSGGVPSSAQQTLFMPLLARMPKQRVKTQVVSLAPGFAPGAVLRQSGVPVHEVSLSTRRFSLGAPAELLNATRLFRPDIIHAWGHTAQLAALAIRTRCEWDPKVVWSVAETTPLPKNAGFIDQQKLKLTAKFAAKVDAIAYTSDAAAAMHRRVGYPEAKPIVIPPGVDPTRFKPDYAARRKVREQLGLASNAFVVGMIAPFQTEYDHPTFLQGVGELIKTNPNLYVLLAGHGVQRGNAPLMALVGGGTLGTRTQLLGDWSDVASFYNACDVACSSSRFDTARMTLVMAMLCGVPCVATGMGAQGEVVGQFGVAIEPGSPVAFVRGIKRVLDMPAERRSFLAHGARKHALSRFIHPRSAQQYLQLYFDLAGIAASAATELPVAEIDATIPTPPVEVVPELASVGADKIASASVEWTDPDTLEAKPTAAAVETKPKTHEGDVLQMFESDLANGVIGKSRDLERARGVAEEHEDLLTPEELHVDAKDAPPPPQQVSPPSKKAAGGSAK